MRLHTVGTDRARHVRLPACPECGDLLLAPLMAEHVNERHVRNHWACESCGHTFRRSFQLQGGQREDRALIS